MCRVKEDLQTVASFVKIIVGHSLVVGFFTPIRHCLTFNVPERLYRSHSVTFIAWNLLSRQCSGVHSTQSSWDKTHAFHLEASLTKCTWSPNPIVSREPECRKTGAWTTSSCYRWLKHKELTVFIIFKSFFQSLTSIPFIFRVNAQQPLLWSISWLLCCLFLLFTCTCTPRSVLEKLKGGCSCSQCGWIT